MPVIPVDRAVGQRLSHTIRSRDGRVLLRAGVVLTAHDARRLQDTFGMRYILVHNEVLPDLDVQDVDLDERVRQDAMNSLRTTIDVVRRRTGKDASVQAFRAAESIVEAVLSADGVPMALAVLRTKEDDLLQHCVNTAAYSALIGIGAGLARRELELVTLGGLLHDLGKALIPVEILAKPGRLTPAEREVMNRHSQLGFEAISRDLPTLPAQVAAVAYQHHERLNGSGYPEGMRGEQIHRFARIVAVADVYDALCAMRPYKPPWPPHRAVAFLVHHPELFERDSVYQLMRKVAVYPTGTIVRLADRSLAVVLSQNADHPEAPFVLVVADHANVPVTPPRAVDLAVAGADLLPIHTASWRWPREVRAALDIEGVRAAARAALFDRGAGATRP
ncbi:MAG: HD-GYP domain-containing protein [Firmicutes bacterium]|nr:HD-GYP domain-containing protein [Bacillota bacterium]